MIQRKGFTLKNVDEKRLFSIYVAIKSIGFIMNDRAKNTNRSKRTSAAALFACTVMFFFAGGFFGLKPDLEKLNAEIDEKFPDAPQVSLLELKRMIAEKSNLILIDARDKEEFAVSRIKNAVNIVDPENLMLEKDRLIIAYCSVGYRSAKFVSKARDLGYTNIFNYRGSIFEWANKGNPVYRDGVVVQEVHPYNRYWGKLLDERLHSKK